MGSQDTSILAFIQQMGKRRVELQYQKRVEKGIQWILCHFSVFRIARYTEELYPLWIYHCFRFNHPILVIRPRFRIHCICSPSKPQEIHSNIGR